MNRNDSIVKLNKVLEWDIVIIGGGASGLGVAVDASKRGYKTLLLEKHDFGKGTSSRSTKLIHGGVRYLQNGDITLVIESLKERGILKRNAPHLVQDLSFVIPTYDWWASPFYGIGMKIYDMMAGKLGLGKSVIISKGETEKLIPNVKRKILIVVPTTSLVEQMYKDFGEYGWMASKHCHKIYSGEEKNSEADCVITTWQSVYKQPRKWFSRFDVVIGDEAHLFKAKSLTTIMHKLHDCKYRYGFTGTLDGANVNQLVLEGVFGRCSKVTKTHELMKKGHVAKLNVKIIVLKHEENIFEGYQDEMTYLVEHEPRNKFIRNLACDLKGNTLILFNYVEKHGLPLYEMINSYTDRPVHLVYGGVDVDDREHIRKLVENETNAIIVASYGTFSTGVNIKRLHNLVFASPSKSRVRNLQSIGRVLRQSRGKVEATLYDIADDISTDKGNNYTLNHLMERLKIYNEEQFNYEIIEVKVKSHDT